MPRLQSDPGLLECPDFASPTYAAARAPLINDNTTAEQAIACLKDIWSAGNEADKAIWQLQVVEDEAAQAEQLRIQSEAEDLRVQAQVEEAEILRKEELKKNKSKYIPSRTGMYLRSLVSLHPTSPSGKWRKGYLWNYGTIPMQV